jgi:hypothetical protein
VLGNLEDKAVAMIVGFERPRIGGSSPSKETSTTAPITWATLPTRLWVFAGACGVLAEPAGFRVRGLVGAAVAISCSSSFRKL